MNLPALRTERLRSHLLATPADSLIDAASHMLAVQSQEFWGGRWALASRTRGSQTLRDVDAAFNRGELVRTWTQRGTIHIVCASDAHWMLSVTGERQLAQSPARFRELGLDDDVFSHAERTARSALTGGNRLTRTELFHALHLEGTETAGQRGVHVLRALSLRGVVVQGPVVAREALPSREQYVVLAEEWLSSAVVPADPLAELFSRYIDGHGPATLRDFAWWSGLTLGDARRAAQSARFDEHEPGMFVAGGRPNRRAVPREILALASFDEYYLAYADRSTAAAPEVAVRVGPGVNGMVRPVLVARGEIVGVWSHSLATGRHRTPPVAEILLRDRATDAEVEAALERYRRFILG